MTETSIFKEIQVASGYSFSSNRVAELARGERLYYGQCPLDIEYPQDLVILVDRKPIALDTILPLILELRREQPDLPIHWLVMDGRYLSQIKQSYVLWNAIQQTGRVAVFTNSSNGIAAKITGRMRQLHRLHVSRIRRVSLLYHRDFASPPIDLLAAAVRRGGGHLIGYASWCYPMSPLRIYGRLEMENSIGRGLRHHRGCGDFWLVPHPGHAEQLGAIVSAPMVVTGTPRAFPAWDEYMTHCLETIGIKDIHGKRINEECDEVITIFYPGNYPLPEMRSETACRDQLQKFLAVISRVAPDITIIIKPHIICKLDELRWDISSFSDLDIRISYAHPQLLARISTAAVFTNGSNVMDDMYLAQIPVIDISDYRLEIQEAGSSFPNAGRIPAATEGEMEQVLGCVLTSPGELPKPDVTHLVWPKVESISKCLWRRGPS